MLRVLLSILVLIVSLLFLGCEQQKEVKYKKHTEKYYQAKLCKRLGGVMEYRLSDKTRVDCLTDEYAIEVDWAKKWAEGVGQSLYYSIMTHRKPAVALIVGYKDKRYIKRLDKVAKKLGIKVFLIEKEKKN